MKPVMTAVTVVVGAVVALAVGAALCFVAVVLVFAEDLGDDPLAGPVPTPTPTVAPATVPGCPPWDAEPDWPGGDLPEDAVSVRLCPGDPGIARPPAWVVAVAPPPEALTSGVPGLVDLVNGLPAAAGPAEGSYCSNERRPRLHYVFGYRDGRQASVTYGYGACGLLELEQPGRFPDAATVAREQADVFADAFSDAVLAQRRRTRPPDRIRPAPSCVPNTRPVTTLPVQELELASASLCVLTADGRAWRRAVVPERLLTELAHEYAAATAPPSLGCQGSIARIVGWSTRNDPVELNGGRCPSWTVGHPPLGDPRGWAMSPTLLDELYALPRGRRVAQR